MKDKLTALCRRYRHIIMYLIVGGLTTVVNFIIYYLPGVSALHYVPRNTVAWCAAVAFAYFANRTLVFGSDRVGLRARAAEAAAFVLSRVFSLVAETALIGLAATLGIGEDISKVPVSVIVVVMNYVTGRIVFRLKK